MSDIIVVLAFVLGLGAVFCIQMIEDNQSVKEACYELTLFDGDKLIARPNGEDNYRTLTGVVFVPAQTIKLMAKLNPLKCTGIPYEPKH